MNGPAAPSSLGLGVAILLLAATATPATATPVAIARCVDVNRQEVGRLVDLEFGKFAHPEALRVSVGCDERGVTLAVQDRSNRRSRTRALDLARTAQSARARLIALAAAELATALLADTPSAAPSPAPAVEAAATAASPPTPASETDTAPSPSASDADTTAVPSPPPASDASSRASTSEAMPRAAVVSKPPASGDLHAAPVRDNLPRLRLLAKIGGAHFFSRLAMTRDVGLTLRHEGWRHLEAALSLTGSLGRITSKGREASAASLSITPLAGLHRRLGPTTARAATGPRLALGRLQASATLPGDQALTFMAPWLAWLVQLGLAAPVGPRFAIEVTVHGGYVLSPIGGRIAGDRSIAVEGPWIGAALSVGALL